jgi:hypothetical protein
MNIRLIMVVVLNVGATTASAYPEFVRHGYFSCTSCHVSPSGGGILTEYGRSYSAEKLATWVRPNEEKALHGLIADKQPEWLLLGGNARQIQTYVDSPRTESGRWIAMQRDVEACVKTQTLTTVHTCATYGLVPSSDEDGGPQYGLRKAAVRIDVGESLALRVGRFFPRFGLMIANHTSAVRAGLGFLPHGETDQIEATYMSELVEATLYRDFGRALELGAGVDELGEASSATGGTVAVLIGDAARSGVSYRRARDDQVTEHSVGGFAAVGVSEATFVLAEIDQKAVVMHDPAPQQAAWRRSVLSHVKLGHEVYRGVVPALVHEVNFSDLSDGYSRSDTYGLGMQWFPRPHFEIEAFYGHVLQRREFSYASAGYLLVHYYL